MKALVAMSGGVDSSVAAALLLEQGHEVVGVTLKQWDGGSGSGCCTVADAEDARRVAAQLDVPYYVLDYSEVFRREVVDPFVAGYLAGTTPNPCVECNRRVRFDRLLAHTTRLGCDVLVTGHHARIRPDRGRYRLARAVDRSKDQSYVLFMLGQDQLRRIRLPIGELTKAEVRDHAARLGLRSAAKPDSQDLCFVASGDYRDFLRARTGRARPGTIVDTAGRPVGRHDGVSGFTIGQRRGLGVAAGARRYVVDIRPETATVVIGSRRDLLVAACRVEGVSFVAEVPGSGDAAGVQVRYRGAAVPATLHLLGEEWEVRFTAPQPAVAPGQAAVFYRDELVLGGGTIAATRSAGPDLV